MQHTHHRSAAMWCSLSACLGFLATLSIAAASSATCSASDTNHAPIRCKPTNAATQAYDISQSITSILLYQSTTGGSAPSTCKKPYTYDGFGPYQAIIGDGYHKTLPSYLTSATRGLVKADDAYVVTATAKILQGGQATGYSAHILAWVDFIGNYQLCSVDVKADNGGASDGLCSC